MSQPAEHLLLSAMAKMIVAYLPSHDDNSTVCQIVNAYDPKPPTPRPTCDTWSSQYASIQAQAVLAKVVTQDDGLKLLGYIAKYGLPIYQKRIPSMQSCAIDIGFTTKEYGYLWDGVGDTPFCRVIIPQDGTINYSPIARIHELQGDPSTTQAPGVIVAQYRNAQTQLDADQMRKACNNGISYSDMSGALKDVCGCYIDIQKVASFSAVEKPFLAQNPQCLPSCLSAAVRYSTGGAPIPCQQSVCIIDDVDISGTTTSITQVCPQCNHQSQCVCYIHLDGRTINNSSCKYTYTIGENGNVISSSSNVSPSFGQGIKDAFEALIKSRAGLIVLIVAVVLIVVGVMIYLVVRHMKGGTSSTRRSIKGSSPFSYQAPGTELATMEK